MIRGDCRSGMHVRVLSVERSLACLLEWPGQAMPNRHRLQESSSTSDLGGIAISCRLPEPETSVMLVPCGPITQGKKHRPQVPRAGNRHTVWHRKRRRSLMMTSGYDPLSR